MELPRSIDTVIVGAGQAGLIMSHHLQAAGRDHVVLDRRETLGGGWQDRWDGFQLVSPNWTTSLPGYPYDGTDADAYMDRDGIVGRIRGYAAAIGAPVSPSTEVLRLTPDGASGRRFHVETSQGPIDADNVIAATGAFHVPKIPPSAAGFSPGITQLHAHHYRNPDQLPVGGVLVVGSGQTGVQLAEELHEAGRHVVLSTGRCGRAPRRYRGRDIFWWLRQLVLRGEEMGTALPRVDELPEPRRRFACNPHVSGPHGGHDTNLRQMGNAGIRLAGRFVGGDGLVASFERDLAANLQFADQFFDVQFRPLCDEYAEKVDETTVLWTTGYAPDYGWLDLPILDEFGVPRHVRGVTEVPGLTLIGALWQYNNGSANLVGVDADAEYLVSRW